MPAISQGGVAVGSGCALSKPGARRLERLKVVGERSQRVAQLRRNGAMEAASARGVQAARLLLGRRACGDGPRYLQGIDSK